MVGKERFLVACKQIYSKKIPYPRNSKKKIRKISKTIKNGYSSIKTF